MRVMRAGYDHPDQSHALAILRGLRAASERATHLADYCQDPALRAELLDALHGVPAGVADTACTVAVFFDQWDEQRGDRQRDAQDRRRADANEERVA